MGREIETLTIRRRYCGSMGVGRTLEGVRPFEAVGSISSSSCSRSIDRSGFLLSFVFCRCCCFYCTSNPFSSRAVKKHQQRQRQK
ncbi:hypothetical protein ACLOJK_003804 [Asimina triloba]